MLVMGRDAEVSSPNYECFLSRIWNEFFPLCFLFVHRSRGDLPTTNATFSKIRSQIQDTIRSLAHQLLVHKSRVMQDLRWPVHQLLPPRYLPPYFQIFLYESRKPQSDALLTVSVQPDRICTVMRRFIKRCELASRNS